MLEPAVTKPFPDAPFLRGNFAPWRMEGEARDLVVRGELPAELRGTLYRNGPNPQLPPRGAYHWFDGDGMIHAFSLRDGRADYRNRWVRTPRFLAERAAGRALLGGLQDLAGSDPSAEGLSRCAANTSVVWHAGRLLALWEAGLPTEIDPASLETRGAFDFEGRLVVRRNPELAAALGVSEVEPGSMTAHPRIDPTTGELLFFGYGALPPHLVFHAVARDGRWLRSEPIETPFPSMIHDFPVSSEHVVFPVFPAALDAGRLAQGLPPVTWEPERGTHVGVMPRRGGPADLVWLRGDPCYAYHFLDTRSDAARVVLELVRYPVLPLFGAPGEGPGALTRWHLDLEAGTLKEEALDDLSVEFPRFDERRAGRGARHAFAAGCFDAAERSPGASPFLFDAIVHYDLASGARRAHRLPRGSTAGEPVFVPRSPEAAEGEGFLLALVYREGEDRSDLLVLDAQDVEAEPLATVELPHRIPYGFHGHWVEGAREIAP
jgi:carotenoid cleavage dioxygenase